MPYCGSTGGIGIVISVGNIVGGRTENIEEIEFHFVYFVLVPRAHIDDAGAAGPERAGFIQRYIPEMTQA